MEHNNKAQLLASMLAGRLVLLCGAGLSMAPPSRLPSARHVAELCFDRYQVAVDPAVELNLRGNLEMFAEHFVTQSQLQTVFIERIVPWNQFMRPSNPGHAAIADFLITGAASAALSANYDTLIERRAWDYGADFQASLDGDQATLRSVTQSPLLKFHGCSYLDRTATVWAPSQLNDPVVGARIARSKAWMDLNLHNKDLLVVGFWSDWDYLNEIIDGALQDTTPQTVTVVDPSPTDTLQEKAPRLWDISHRQGVIFTHVQESGATVLDELRQAYSGNYLASISASGRVAFEQQTQTPVDPEWLQPLALDSEALYGLRLDAEGVPAGIPATERQPRLNEVLGLFHLLMRRAGAVPTNIGYHLNGRSVRVVNGGQQTLSTLREKFVEAPILASADIVVAPGAVDLGVPANIVRAGAEGDIIRPAAQGSWLDFQSGRQELGI